MPNCFVVPNSTILVLEALTGVSQTILTEFDEMLWISFVEKVTVFHDKVVFTFKNGIEIEK